MNQLQLSLSESQKSNLQPSPRIPDQFPLLKKQNRLRPWLPLINGFCNFSAFVLRRPKLNARDNTRRCYEHFFDPLCSETGVWPDYTEGHYPTGAESYTTGKQNQFDFILDQTRSEAGTRVVDLGCGNGRLLMRAKERGCHASGITVSRVQQATCLELGLDVHVASFQQVEEVFPPGQFDVVIMNGPTEHFVTEEDILNGRKEEVQAEIFAKAAYLLRPGGRVFITCIHQIETADVQEVIQPPLKHEVGSMNFFCSILVGLYSGWYPEQGDYERAAEKSGLKKVFQRDATEDYYHTSRLWGRMLRGYLKEHKGFRNRFLMKLFYQDPRYFFTALLYWYYDAWTWQFRPVEGPDGPTAPMQHLWLMFENQAPAS